MAEGYAKVVVTDPDGWQKEFVLNSPVAYAGSDQAANIWLHHPQIAPRHLQLMQLQPAGVRVVNLGADELCIGRSRSSSNGSTPGDLTPLASRKASDLDDGDWIDMYGFRLNFHYGERRSTNFEVRLELPPAAVTPDKPLEGAVIITHTGNIAGVQFKVEMQGYDPQFLQIDPGPMLFPGVERPVKFRLLHTRRPLPPAGNIMIAAVVTAPEDYPGDVVVTRQTVTIAPYRAYQVHVEPARPG